MSEHEERPLRLEELADVESVDVMRAALRRFRRRTLVRGILVILVLLALPATLRGLSEKDDPFQVKLGRARAHQVGRILHQGDLTVIVLEARRLQVEDMRPEYEPGRSPIETEGNRMLHLVVTASGILNDETLAKSPLTISPEAAPRDGRRDERALELWVPFARGQTQIEFDVAALTGRSGGSRGPGSHSADQCAIPLNPVGVCELLKEEGRIIGHVSIDLSLLVPSEILE